MAPAYVQTLADRGFLTSAQVEWLDEQCAERRLSPVEAILAADLVPEETMLQAISESSGLAYIKLRDVAVSEDAILSVPSKLASHYGVFPIERTARGLTIAVSDPGQHAVIEDLQVTVGVRIERVLATRQEIDDAIRRHGGDHGDLHAAMCV